MDPTTGLLTEAEVLATEAWGRYRSTCMTGGTPEQRAWAYQNAVAAEQKLWRAEQAPAANV